MEGHERTKSFKCNQCEKEFFLQWRLNQHIRGHGKIHKRFCHYYNNSKSCPYENVGCKFVHELSAICSFGNRCNVGMCQFRHDVVNEPKTDELSISNDKSEAAKNSMDANVETLCLNKSEQLGDALEKVDNLEKKNIAFEKKLKLYSATIRKLRSERESY